MSVFRWVGLPIRGFIGVCCMILIPVFMFSFALLGVYDYWDNADFLDLIRIIWLDWVWNNEL